MAKRRKSPPYWIRATELICTMCSGSFAHAVEVRCNACDRSICPSCVAHHLREMYCADCRPERRT